MTLRRCRWCREEFDPRPESKRRGPWPRYCSDRCRTEAARARAYLRQLGGKTVRDTRAARRERNKKIAQRAKTAGCSACGAHPDPVALDFHHRDRRTKLDTVSQLVNRGASLKRLEAEIAKCDVLCANCHRTVHYSVTAC